MEQTTAQTAAVAEAIEATEAPAAAAIETAEAPAAAAAPTPTVFVSGKLADYLAAKKRRFILMDLAQCQSCGGDVCEAFARVAKDAEGERLIQATQALEGVTLSVNQYSNKANHARTRVFDCVAEDGTPLLVEGKPVQLLVTHRLIRVESQVRLDMRRVLGVVDITVQGAAF